MSERKSRRETTAPPDSDDLDEIVTALLTASRTLVGVSAQSLAVVEESVTLTQFRTLVVLHAHGGARLSRLAERLQVNASTALRSVDRLIAAGFVDRHENADDRREVVLGLTGRGRSLVDEVTARRRQAIEEIVVAMPASRRREMVRTLLAFAKAADEPVAASDSATLLGW